MDTIDLDFVVIPRYMDAQTSDFSDFTRTHLMFLVYVETPGHGAQWLEMYLPSVARMEILKLESGRKLYLVKMNDQTLPHP